MRVGGCVSAWVGGCTVVRARACVRVCAHVNVYVLM